MSKRGVAILLLSSIGLLVAVLLFFTSLNKTNVVGNSTFLGEAESQVLGAYSRGEQLMIFLESSAVLSLKQKEFGDEFSKYLDKANSIFGSDLSIKDYTFERTGQSLKAVCSRSIVIKNTNVRYTINPSFIVYY